MAQSVRYTPGHTYRVCCIPLESKSQVILHWTEEAGDHTRWQANSFDVELGQHSAEPTVCHLDILQESEVGLSFGFEVLTARLRARHFCLRL